MYKRDIWSILKQKSTYSILGIAMIVVLFSMFFHNILIYFSPAQCEEFIPFLDFVKMIGGFIALMAVLFIFSTVAFFVLFFLLSFIIAPLAFFLLVKVNWPKLETSITTPQILRDNKVYRWFNRNDETIAVITGVSLIVFVIVFISVECTKFYYCL